VRSMTGYGESLISEEGTEVFVQIKTLNHRFLQVSIVYPEDIPWRLENKIEEKIREKIYRGKVLVNLQVTRKNPHFTQIEPDFELAALYFNALKEIKEKLDLKEQVGLSHLLGMPGVVRVEKNKWERLEQLLLRAVEQALEQVIQSRKSEGEKHLKEVVKYTKKIKSSINYIKKEAPSMQKNYREKIQEELKKAYSEDSSVFPSPNHINSKLALMITKGDITEEIVRFNSHLSQLNRSLNQQKAIGKKLAFILQELQREANTIGAKSLSYSISNEVVKIKDNIEKIREQINNIE